MENEIIFSVVVPTYNRLLSLKKTLQSLFSQNFEKNAYEIIVVDDGSTDGTKEWLEILSREKKIVYIQQKHSGAAVARNKGIRNAYGFYIAFTDDDCIVPHNWLMQFSGHFRNSNISAVGGKIVNKIEDNIFSETSLAISNFISSRLNKEPHNANFVTSNNIAYRKAELERVEMFDERFFVGAEDRELNYRIKANGGKIFYDDSIVVEHYNVLNFKTFVRQQFNYGKGAYLFYKIIRDNFSVHSKQLSYKCYLDMLMYISEGHGIWRGLSMKMAFIISQLSICIGYIYAPLFGKTDPQKKTIHTSFNTPNKSSMNKSSNVLIMGAGPAGLSAGYVLSKQNVDTIICEQADVVGGLARTVYKNGFRFDIGGHRFFTKNDEIHQFVMDLMGDEVIKVKRKSRIYFRGKFIDYPLTFVNSLLGVGIPDCFIVPFDYVSVKIHSRFNGKKITSFEDWGVSQFGRRMFELFFKSYTEKIWGIPCNQISADWARQRIKGMSLKKALGNALFKWRNNGTASMINEFHYFKQGYGRISERLAEYIQKTNQFYLKTRVVQVQHSGSRIKATTVDRNGNRSIINADYFISSIPITILVQIMDPPPPEEVINAAKRLRYRDLITVHLMINRQQVTQDHWIYFHDQSIDFARIHEPKNWSVEMSPTGKTSLVIEYFCNRGDKTWDRSDENLIDMSVRNLTDKLGLIKKGEVIDGFVFRHPKAYPMYDIDYKTHLHKIYHFLSNFKNLYVIGRYGMFRYNNCDHSIETGIKAARNILGENYELAQVNLEEEYLEEKKVVNVRHV